MWYLRVLQMEQAGGTSALENWDDRVREFAAGPASSLPVVLTALLLITASIAGLTVMAGVARTNVYSPDVLQFLANGWKCYNGLKPYHDYFPMLGSLQDYRTAAAIWLGKGSPEGIGYLSAIMVSLISLWSFAVLQSRMNRWVCLLASVTLGLLIANPTPLGRLVSEYSRAMEYNRLGYALVGFILLELFQAPRPTSGTGSRIFGSASTGLLLGVMAFHKPTYFVVAAGALLLAAAMGSVSRSRLLWTLGVAALSFGALYGYLRPGMALIAGYAGVSGSAAGQARLSPVRIVGKILLYQADFWALAAAGYFARRRDDLGPAIWRPTLIAGFTFLAGICLLSTNAQDYGMPLTGIGLLIFLNQSVDSFSASTVKSDRRLAAAAALLAFVYWLGPVAKDGMSLALAVKDKHDSAPPKAKDIISGVPGRQIEYDQEEDHWVVFVNDGIRLTAANTRPDECVVALSGEDPYAYFLDRKPCKGGQSLYTNALGDLSKLSQQSLIGDPDVILAPKPDTVDWKHGESLMVRFTPLLQSKYTPIGDSQFWTLYRKR